VKYCRCINGALTKCGNAREVAEELWLKLSCATCDPCSVTSLPPCRTPTETFMQRLWLLRRRFKDPITQCLQSRNLTTLAIETSCDDTSVAILEKHENNSATLHFHDKITSDNRTYGGIHPIVAHESHQQTLASLIQRAVSDTARKLRTGWKPDFITVTRGPGMRPNLTTGLDTAKGLAVAWQIPLLGVNHMQAHALTPRLVSALYDAETCIHKRKNNPPFPFLSLLVSGGHTMLVHTRSLCDHQILANTTDIAIGDVIDKCARDILPASCLNSAPNVMYGRLLEEFTFPGNDKQHNYSPPTSFNRPREATGYDWILNPPYPSPGPGGPISYAGAFSYSGIGSSVKRIMTKTPDMDETGRRILAREAMAVAFEHLASRVLFALNREDVQEVKALVVSGGVASNQFLKVILRTILNVKGYQHIDLVFPPPKYCTDNAAMIAWTGIEMFEAGYRTSLAAMAIRKWAIDPRAKDGGILGPDAWIRVDEIPT
jgi:N6-L-threonylcarbamoyladenine synthase